MASQNPCANKPILFFALLAFLPLFSPDLQAQTLNGWKLVWSDEFNGVALDTNKWSLELNEGDPGIAAYTSRPQNLFVSNGNLVLQGQKEAYNGKNYTSTQISSRNKGSWKYCRVDVRAKMPFGQGMWPAIWMMPMQPVAYGKWPRSGEIDIMENLGNNTRVLYTTLHYGASNQSSQGTDTTAATQTLSDSFHVYTMIWDSGSFSFTLDSVHNYYSVNKWSPDNVAYPEPFDRPFFLIFDLAIGGSWAGPPDSATLFPQKMTVDWVRVYQRQAIVATLPSPVVRGDGGFNARVRGNVLWYEVEKEMDVWIGLFDGLGRRVVALADGRKPAGRNSVVIPSGVRAGVYLCEIEGGGKRAAEKVWVR
jgi:beta-glucanase (GH16 family)